MKKYLIIALIYIVYLVYLVLDTFLLLELGVDITSTGWKLPILHALIINYPFYRIMKHYKN